MIYKKTKWRRRVIETLDHAMNVEPELERYGIGRDLGGWLDPTNDDDAISIYASLLWLDGSPLSRRELGSYLLKHEVERAFGHYVPSGALMAASIGSGRPYRKISRMGIGLPAKPYRVDPNAIAEIHGLLRHGAEPAIRLCA